MFELQVFNGREYEPVARDESGRVLRGYLWDNLGPSATKKPHRIVLTAKERAARPKYTKPRGQNGPSKGPTETIRAYLEWARAAGLDTVTFYDDCRFNYLMAEWPNARRVKVADILGPAPAAHIETDGLPRLFAASEAEAMAA
jgi:hypothetical protein